MRKKIFKTTLFVTMCTLLLCVGMVIGMVYNFFDKNYSAELSNKADYIASGIEEYGIELVEKLDTGTVRVSYISHTGEVLYDNKASLENMASHKNREEFIEAIESGKGESVRLSETLSEKTYYISRRLENGDVVRISDTRESEFALLVKLFVQILFVVVLSVLLSAVFSRRLAKGVVKPINELDLTEPKKEKVYEELYPLIERIAEQRKMIDEQMRLLKEERQSFLQITGNMSEGLIVIDKGGNILSANKAAGKILEWGGEAPGGNILSFINSKELKNCIGETLSGNHQSFVWERDKKFTDVFLNPVYEKEKVIGALVFLMDVTERENREVLRREFSANVSHELKTPLTSIFAASEMMRSGMVKKEDTFIFADRIYTEARKLINLVNDIIKLSRLDEGSMTDLFEDTDCSFIVKKAVSEFKNDAEKKEITIFEEIDVVTMSCIPHLFKEMVSNLISNAVKYTPEKGSVTVKLKKDKNVIFSVSDTGIGIPAGEIERIFERFYRVDRSHTKEVEGTGLGLSIVKHGAIIHDAKIITESAEGKGSTFTVVFKG